MHLDGFLQIAVLMVLSFVVAFAVLCALGVLIARQSKNAKGFMAEKDQRTSFLFEDEKLLDATEDARLVLSIADPAQSDWTKMIAVFAPKYPGLPEALETLTDTIFFNISSADNTSNIEAEWSSGLVYIGITDEARDIRADGQDSLTIAAMEREIETLRATTKAAPFLVWRQRVDGTILWANNTYLELASKCDPDRQNPSWPPNKLFDSIRFEEEPGIKQARLTLLVPGEPEPRWFDCQQTSVGDDRLFTATSADNLVIAETALRDFVQTLTKTFAHLTTGLMIFDKQRELSLFNPAMSDLTSLSPEFLSARPTLHSVLNQLRERRMIPEPKDYKSWRERMHDLETAAKEGTYEETWSLASGQTFRVVGRPHPDGAVAFIIEDISAEVSLARRYRSELETGQAVIDSFEEAIAVFSADGTLTLSNSAYARVWGTDPSTTLLNHCISDATKLWTDNCAPTPIWDHVREFVGAFGDRSAWKTEVQSKNGQILMCRFSPLSGGGALIGFAPHPAQKSTLPDRMGTQPGVIEGSLAI